ncbi:MAG: pyridoxamine 5'-phosphate oxidase family protein [Hyphomicrobium aestuarii]|nr:pyridoxamine 5'-phosphate oxidase family protein [Hyphomicrobium aestuarii]
MTSRFLNLVFTPSVKAAQVANGSRDAYARRDSASEADRLTENEIAFIAGRDSFYMATVGAGGWPYMQHRGGPPGFVKILNERTLGLADFRGNRQYVTVGNLVDDDRASLFFMDYVRRARLKLLGRVRAIDLAEAPELSAALVDQDYGAKIERGLIIDVEAIDWNCPQHITPRFTTAELTPTIEALKARIAELEAEIGNNLSAI